MKTDGFRMIDTFRARGLRAWLAALVLLSGCVNTAELTPAIDPSPSHRPPRQASTAFDSPEFQANEPVAQPDVDRGLGVIPLVPGIIAWFDDLVGKPARQPVTSLHRLLVFAANTTLDLVMSTIPDFTTDAPVPPISERPGMDLGEWERTLDALTGSATLNGTIRFLIDGDQFFPTLVDAVMDAQSSVDVRIYVFDTDDYATAFADLLKNRSDDVDVRVLLDGLGTLLAAEVAPSSMPPDFVQPGSIARYLQRDSEVAVRVQSNPWFTGDHTKTFVIDRQVAFVGGMNIAREYRYEWHDLMMEVRGPIVGLIDQEFNKAWSRAGFFGDLGYLAYKLRPRKEVEPGDGYPIRPLFTRVGDSQIYRAQLAAIRAARRYIYIENPYLSDDAILRELVKARRRGVDVRVILPFRGDSTVIDYSNVLAANTMFRNGIRVYLYPGFTHVKAAVFDGWICVGSANFDKMSLRVNEEFNLATSDEETVRALEQRLFEPDFAVSTEMTEPLPSNWSHQLAEFLADQL